jgi:cytochrome bd ubiquinol oxidase subunit I
VDVLDLSRGPFGVTTVNRFLFAPITMGMGFLVAGVETALVRTRRERWPRLTKFHRKPFLTNSAIGVIKGIRQEFEFDRNWSAYVRIVSNILGAWVAIGALPAFFLESTFSGLWVFGGERLPPRLHAACR